MREGKGTLAGPDGLDGGIVRLEDDGIVMGVLGSNRFTCRNEKSEAPTGRIKAEVTSSHVPSKVVVYCTCTG